jgi:hypothetical protein
LVVRDDALEVGRCPDEVFYSGCSHHQIQKNILIVCVSAVPISTVQGMALVSAKATRLPVYSSFAKEGNLSDLYAKGEASSTLSNVLGLGVGIHLASNFGASIQGKVCLSICSS